MGTLEISDVQTRNFYADLMNNRANLYAEFLHDGDFETWQPVCYMDKNTQEYKDMVVQAQREILRLLWILNRLPEYLQGEWQYLLNIFIVEEWNLKRKIIDPHDKNNFEEACKNYKTFRKKYKI